MNILTTFNITLSFKAFSHQHKPKFVCWGPVGIGKNTLRAKVTFITVINAD